MSLPIPPLEFADIPKGTYTLGWRFDSIITEEMRFELDKFIPFEQMKAQFSPKRVVSIDTFQIATTTIDVDPILETIDENQRPESLDEICSLVDTALAPLGFRLPTEDELEIALGEHLFFFGNNIPDGTPLENDTRFTDHCRPNGAGLSIDPDPYTCELVKSALKLGDGGASICGGYPWPTAWLSLASCHTLKTHDIAEYLCEFLETTQIRPVRL